jgi:phospholipase/carboxylesterase
MTLDGPRWGPREGKARQLVVICHGVGADGHDLIDLAPSWAAALPHAAFVAPDAPERYDMVPEGIPTGRQWFSLADRTPVRLEAGVAVAAEILGRFIDGELKRLGLPADAYAMVGFSQGAMTALYTGLRRAPPPRAILAYSGALLAPDQPVPSRPPVLLVHGEADEVVPPVRSRLAEQALRDKDVSVESRFCPGLGHGIDEAGLSAGALFLQRAFADTSA